MEGYIGCKVKQTNKYTKLTQPVKVQQFINEFRYKGGSSKPPETPVKAGSQCTKKLTSNTARTQTVLIHSRY